MRRVIASWVLLASRRAPLVVGCLKPLFEENQDELRWEDAVEKLAEMFAEHANNDEFGIVAGEQMPMARAELRDWLKRGLVVEREGRLIATDALQKAFHFLDSLEDEHMTSTASRLATVQREIENLEARLNPDRSKTEYDGTNDSAGSSRGLRGGSWFSGVGGYLASAIRYNGGPSGESPDVGFRVASVPEPTSVVLAMVASGMLLIRRKR
jgi:hypothetical protein